MLTLEPSAAKTMAGKNGSHGSHPIHLHPVRNPL